MALHTEPNDSANYNKFVRTYSYGDLMKHHSLEEWGLWNVYGEDPNCDLGGSHANPYLGAIEGKLADVIREAVGLPGFWQWGGGGKIEKVTPKSIGRKATVENVRKVKDFTTPDHLFQLIRQRTEEGKLIGTGKFSSNSKLEGTVPGTPFRCTLEYHSERDGDWHSLDITVSGKTVSVGTEAEIRALRRYITEKPSQDAMSEAREILENL